MKTLSCKGLTDKDQLVLKSLVDLTISRTSDTWAFSEDDETDVVIVDTDNIPDSRSLLDEIEARRGVAIEFSNNTASSSRFRIQKPLRAANLISVFNSVESQFTNDKSADSSPISNTGTASNDASGILTLLSDGKTDHLKVSAGNTTCTLDLMGDRYAIQGDLALADLLGSAEKSITTTPEWNNDTATTWQPMPSLKWLLGIHFSSGELIGKLHSGSRFKLQHWPPTELARLTPHSMTLSAILGRKSGATISEASAKSGLPDKDIISFINGAYLAQAISIRSISLDTEEANANSPEPHPKGLFDKIRDRLTRKSR